MIKNKQEFKTIIEEYVNFILEYGEYEQKRKLRNIVTGSDIEKIPKICEIAKEIADKRIYKNQ